jgi:hypothetical protein
VLGSLADPGLGVVLGAQRDPEELTFSEYSLEGSGAKSEDAQRPGGSNSGKRSSLDELFKGRHFLAEVIVVSVRWYLEYKLSSRAISRALWPNEKSALITRPFFVGSAGTRRNLSRNGTAMRISSVHRSVMACRRDVREGRRHMDVSLSRRRQERKEYGFASQPQTYGRRVEDIFA